MKTTFRRRFRNTFLALTALFVGLFIFRVIYTYTSANIIREDFFQPVQNLMNDINVKRNYASARFEFSGSGKTVGGLQGQKPIEVDQKYEKIASVNSTTDQFEEDERKTKQVIEEHRAIIQFEQKTGTVGRRRVALHIGVQPNRFEEFYSEILEIAKVLATEVTKTDKTNEYRQLNAKILSLEKIRNSLVDLKSKGGNIEEFINLENRVLEIEEQLQGLGVQLGNFDEENEFCTVRFSLVEHAKQRPQSLMQRLTQSLEWTLKVYLQLIFVLVLIAIFAYLFLLIIDKFGVLTKVVERFREKQS